MATGPDHAIALGELPSAERPAKKNAQPCKKVLTPAERFCSNKTDSGGKTANQS
jgi:hypothetical protein